MPMTLKILIPSEVFAVHQGVLRMVAETREGSLGVLPRRRDYAAVLVPGILLYDTESDGERYLAVDEGVMIKTGAEVVVSVRQAVAGGDLGQLRETVLREFSALDEDEQNVRAVLAKLETGFLQRLARFQHE